MYNAENGEIRTHPFEDVGDEMRQSVCCAGQLSLLPWANTDHLDPRHKYLLYFLNIF